MRLLTSLLLIFSINTYAAPPSGPGSEAGTVINYSNNIKAPNFQVTKLSGVNSRIETGNQNLLADPSFEAATLSASWITINGLLTANSTNKVDGKKSLSIDPNGSTLTFYQLSTINAADIVGLQGMASVYVKTSLSDVSVCSMVASAEDKCMTVTGNNSWQQVQIPFIMNGTNNGIKVKTISSTTGTILVDNAFVGLSSPFQNVNGAQLLGSVVITGCASSWDTSSATLASFAVQTGCVYTTYGSASSPSTMIPAIKFSSMPAGDYKLEYSGLFRSNASASQTQMYLQFSDGTNVARELESALSGGGSSVMGSPNISQSISYSTNQSNVTLEIKAKTSAGAMSLFGTTAQPAVIKVWYFPPQSRIYSTASQDYAYTNAGTITIGATTTAPTKGTIVTDRIMASRKGQRLNAEYQYEQSSVGTAGSGDYLYSLPTVSGVQLQFDSSIVGFYTGAAPTNQAGLGRALVGYGKAYGDGSFTYNVQLIAYDSTRFRALISYGSTGNRFVDNTVWHLGFSTSSYNFKLDAPISGWQDYGVIVGTFGGVPSVPGLSTGVDTFSVSYGATATTACTANAPCAYNDTIGTTGNFISHGVSTGIYTVNMSKTYAKLKCTVNCYFGTTGVCITTPINCSSCSTTTFTNTNYSSGTAGDSYGTLYCQGTY